MANRNEQGEQRTSQETPSPRVSRSRRNCSSPPCGTGPGIASTLCSFSGAWARCTVPMKASQATGAPGAASSRAEVAPGRSSGAASRSPFGIIQPRRCSRSRNGSPARRQWRRSSRVARWSLIRRQHQLAAPEPGWAALIRLRDCLDHIFAGHHESRAGCTAPLPPVVGGSQDGSAAAGESPLIRLRTGGRAGIQTR